jgi:hypothetical protein
MLNYGEWLTRGMPRRFEKVTTMFWANRTDDEQLMDPFFISDSTNIQNTYSDNYMQIKYPNNWKYSTNVYAGNGMTHVVFCPQTNYNHKKKHCKMSEPSDDYPLGRYLEPVISVNHMHEEIQHVIDNPNIYYLGHNSLGEFYISFRSTEEEEKEMKLLVFDMLKTSMVLPNSSLEEDNLSYLYMEDSMIIKLPESKNVEEYDESFVDYFHSADKFI